VLFNLGAFVFQDKDVADDACKDVSLEMRVDNDKVNGENGNCSHGCHLLIRLQTSCYYFARLHIICFFLCIGFFLFKFRVFLFFS